MCNPIYLTLWYISMVMHTMYNLMPDEGEDLERWAVQRLVEQRLPAIKLVGMTATTSELLV